MIYDNLAYCYKFGIGCEKNIFEYLRYSKLSNKKIDINEYQEILSLYDTNNDNAKKIKQLEEKLIEMKYMPLGYLESKNNFELRAGKLKRRKSI